MDNYPSTVFERTVLTYCVEGLEAREELLVKAFIRLLDHLTHQQWRYQAPDEQTDIHLLLAARGTAGVFARRYGKLPSALLELGHGGDSRHGYLSWPLRPDALEAELNRLGGLAKTQRPFLSPPISPPISSPSASASSSSPSSDPHLKEMRLQQWPPTHLLAGPGRMRLATLLTGKAMDLDALVRHSRLDLATCQAFVGELKQAGLLLLTSPITPTAPTVSTTSPGSSTLPGPDGAHRMLSRPAESASIAASSGKVKAGPIGLLDRIRMRLGIQSPGR